MAFTAKDVQALRERSGCGMMDCKKALTESNGDMEKAIELLREKGLAAAAVRFRHCNPSKPGFLPKKFQIPPGLPAPGH